ncbi:uncharacterized protein HGUI_02520 [Hanseniaspora guilliermondii]|uniref:Uncharacterized protein n=1 Tax=Hanseniaspora guilliermondii TaxID=56406 RepID=A0A1L0B1L0_9ASCO|nr:uncharacterized protein HGUI_02520 [Hanseniaspora guilliermondii]
MANKRIEKVHKKPKTKIPSKKLNFITNYIEDMIELPISEYNEDPKNTDMLILNTLINMTKFLLFLVPVLYYITYLNNKKVSCDDYSNSNGLLFNSKTKSIDLYCKTGYQSKYTPESVYGLYTKQKKCIPLPLNAKEKALYKSLLASKKIYKYENVKIADLSSQINTLLKKVLHDTFNEYHLKNSDKFKLKKINNYYMKLAKANDIFHNRQLRYSNKKSIFYRKPSK